MQYSKQAGKSQTCLRWGFGGQGIRTPDW